MEVPPMAVILQGVFYHFIVSINLTRSAMRRFQAHPLGADASGALQGALLLAVSSGRICAIRGLN